MYIGLFHPAPFLFALLTCLATAGTLTIIIFSFCVLFHAFATGVTVATTPNAAIVAIYIGSSIPTNLSVRSTVPNITTTAIATYTTAATTITTSCSIYLIPFCRTLI